MVGSSVELLAPKLICSSGPRQREGAALVFHVAVVCTHVHITIFSDVVELVIAITTEVVHALGSFTTVFSANYMAQSSSDSAVFPHRMPKSSP